MRVGIIGLGGFRQSLGGGNNRRPRADQIRQARGIDPAATGLESIGRDRLRQGDFAQSKGVFRPIVERIDAPGAQVEPIVGGGLQAVENAMRLPGPASPIDPQWRIATAGVKGVDGLELHADFRRGLGHLALGAAERGADGAIGRRLFGAVNFAGGLRLNGRCGNLRRRLGRGLRRSLGGGGV